MTAMTRGLVTALLAVGASLVFTPAHAGAQKKARDLITREELMASAQASGDLFQAIRNLRPRFLEMPAGVRSFGNSAPPPKLLVVDGNRQAGLDGLRMIMVNTVQEVRHVEPSRAESDYGAAGGSGAIVIKLYKAEKVTKDSTPPARE